MSLIMLFRGKLELRLPHAFLPYTTISTENSSTQNGFERVSDAQHGDWHAVGWIPVWTSEAVGLLPLPSLSRLAPRAARGLGGPRGYLEVSSPTFPCSLLSQILTVRRDLPSPFLPKEPFFPFALRVLAAGTPFRKY